MRRSSGPCLAALVATMAACAIGVAKPPDLPNDPKIIVTTPLCPNDCPPLIAPVWLNIHPFVALDLEEYVAGPECVCPRGQQVKPRVVDANPWPSVLDNLRKLEQAAEKMNEARELVWAGRWVEALECLAVVYQLCPGSSLARRAEEGACAIMAGVEWAAGSSDAAEEQEVPRTETCEQPAGPRMCAGSVCPKCEELHRRHVAGVDAMVSGLMKACHLAVADGRHDKAAELARQAYALDPERVEGDPIVYKLHLLSEKCRTDRPDSDGPQANAGVEGGDRPPARVGQIFVVGNERTRMNVILRQVPLYPGQVLTYPDVRQAEKNLTRLNIFETAPDGSVRPTVTVLDPPYNPDSPYKDILVQVQEASTGSLMFGLGVNSDGGLTGSIVLNERKFDTPCCPCEFKGLLNAEAFPSACSCLWNLFFAPPVRSDKGFLRLGLSPTGWVDVDWQTPCCGKMVRVMLRDGIPLVWVVSEAKAE